MPRPMGQACPACGKVFLTNGLQQHLMRCQPGLIKHECTLCKGHFTTAEPRHHFDAGSYRHLREYNTSRRSTASNPAVVQSKTRAGSQVGGAPLSTNRTVDSSGRVRCSHCGRGSAPARVHVHERACARGQTPRRGVYNSCRPDGTSDRCTQCGPTRRRRGRAHQCSKFYSEGPDVWR